MPRIRSLAVAFLRAVDSRPAWLASHQWGVERTRRFWLLTGIEVGGRGSAERTGRAPVDLGNHIRDIRNILLEQLIEPIAGEGGHHAEILHNSLPPVGLADKLVAGANLA